MLANAFPICYPADSLMGRSPRWGVVLYGLAPSVVIQNAVFPTQIYVRPGWALKLKQILKHGLLAVFGSIAKAFGSSRRPN